MIALKCPRCGEAMSVPASLAGARQACPSCGAVATVPRGRPGARIDPLGDLAKITAGGGPAPTASPGLRPGFAVLATRLLGLISIIGATAGTIGMMLTAAQADRLWPWWIPAGILLGGWVQGSVLLAISDALMYLRRITERMERS